MLALVIFVGVLALVIALAAEKRSTQDPGTRKEPKEDPEKRMSVAKAIALGVALVVGAVGLWVVGAAILFALAMSSYGSNK